MKDDRRKVALIGVGMVGASYAYAMLNQNVCDELVLIDIDEKRAQGEAMDLMHGLAFAPSSLRVWAGGYEHIRDADIAVLCAGAAQQPGESRLALLRRNVRVYREIVENIVRSGFCGVLLVAVNPVDVMARVVQQLSGFAPCRVFGSGTALDTGRLRHLLAGYFQVNPRNLHAYVMGEHGDSGFVPWSQAMLATRRLREVCRQSQGRLRMEALTALEREVRGCAQAIIEAKHATYYGIGLVLCRITRAIFEDENGVLTLSVRLGALYDGGDIYAGVPCVVHREGIRETIPLALTEGEKNKMRRSLRILDEAYRSIEGMLRG